MDNDHAGALHAPAVGPVAACHGIAIDDVSLAVVKGVGFTLSTTGKPFGLGLNFSVTVPTGARSFHQTIRML